jgi:regulator of sirC expression with transglutaminase-like and TPR domain
MDKTALPYLEQLYLSEINLLTDLMVSEIVDSSINLKVFNIYRCKNISSNAIKILVNSSSRRLGPSSTLRDKSLIRTNLKSFSIAINDVNYLENVDNLLIDFILIFQSLI